MSHECHGVSAHWRLHCVSNSLFRVTSKKKSMPRITGLLYGVPHYSCYWHFVRESKRCIPLTKGRWRVKRFHIMLLPLIIITWWRHQIETSSALLAICAGNSPVPGEFPEQRPVTRSLMFSLICVWISDWVNNREAGDLRRYRTHYDFTVLILQIYSLALNTYCERF